MTYATFNPGNIQPSWTQILFPTEYSTTSSIIPKTMVQAWTFEPRQMSHLSDPLSITNEVIGSVVAKNGAIHHSNK